MAHDNSTFHLTLTIQHLQLVFKLSYKPISHARFGDQEFRLVRVVFYFFSQLCNEYTQVLRLVLHITGPHT